MNYMNNCASCQGARRDEFPSDMPIGMAYVPWQSWDKLYDWDKGYHTGTIFPSLDKPFMGRCINK